MTPIYSLRQPCRSCSGYCSFNKSGVLVLVFQKTQCELYIWQYLVSYRLISVFVQTSLSKTIIIKSVLHSCINILLILYGLLASGTHFIFIIFRFKIFIKHNTLVAIMWYCVMGELFDNSWTIQKIRKFSAQMRINLFNFESEEI